MMKKDIFIDIHTHKQLDSVGVRSIISFSIDQNIPLLPKEQKISIGLHPWNINSCSPDWIDKIEQIIKQKSIAAIGETGLDRIKGPAIDIQKEIFKRQAFLAEKYQLPLIIHCVKAFNELIQIKKEIQPSVPWILHGYNGNKTITQQLLTHHFMFSFGKQLLNSSSKARQAITNIPAYRLFFETDEASETIESIYQIASFLLNIPIDLLIGIIFDNYKKIFSC